MQGLLHRVDDPRFVGLSLTAAVDRACSDAGCVMVNRNRGSGTRVLIDGLLKGRKPPGHAVEVRSHNAVAASVGQKRADWGVAIEPVSGVYGLAFLPLRPERYDLAIPSVRWGRPAVVAFRTLLQAPETRRVLADRE
jgi:putative molybdopterin biosynthesis protein